VRVKHGFSFRQNITHVLPFFDQNLNPQLNHEAVLSSFETMSNILVRFVSLMVKKARFRRNCALIRKRS